MCLYSSPFTCVNRLALCFGALPFNNHLEIHLQNGSVFCIWSRALCLSSVRGFSVTSWVVFTVVRSGVTVSLSGWVLEGSVFMVVWHWCDVLLLVLDAGPLEMVVVSILIVAFLYHLVVQLIWRGSQWPCSMFLRSIQTWCCRSQVPSSHLLTLLLVFFPFRNLASGLWSLWTIMSAPWR